MILLNYSASSNRYKNKITRIHNQLAGVDYAAIGLWMILDKRNSKIPYGIAIIGSVALLAIYVASRTIGISSLGLEPIGLLDLIVGMLQGGIIAGSL